MSQSLPTHGFKWMKNLTIDTLMSILDKANYSMIDPKNQGVQPSRGYIFEVDLEYPSELWDTHNDYPLAPERLNVNGVEN